jgi:outer membrane receptor for monomeric catechols
MKEWGITANYAYYDAKITNNPADTGAVGKRPVGVPSGSAPLWTTYTIGSGTLEGLGFGGGVTYRGEIYFDAHNTKIVPSYMIGDATLFYRASAFEARIDVTNVTDEIYYRNGVNAGALPVRIIYAIGGPTPGILSITGALIWFRKRRGGTKRSRKDHRLEPTIPLTQNS